MADVDDIWDDKEFEQYEYNQLQKSRSDARSMGITKSKARALKLPDNYPKPEYEGSDGKLIDNFEKQMLEILINIDNDNKKKELM